MSFSNQDSISISVKEAAERQNGKRVIRCLELELSNSIPCEYFTGNERTDWFIGTSHILTFEQAEALARSILDKVEYCKSLESKGLVIINDSTHEQGE